MAAHSHLLVNGKVLFWPSFANGDNPTLWDPLANTFSTPPKAAYNIFCTGHSFLQDGRLFVTGGHAGNNSDGLIYSSVYDPVQNSWTQTADMNVARWYPTNTTLPNGNVLTVSGYSLTGTFDTLPQVWNPATNTWRNLTNAQLMLPLYPWMFVAPNGQVFNAGDATEARTPTLTSRYLDTSGTGAWTPVGTYNYSGLRDYGSAVMFDGKILIAGGDGASAGTTATNTAEVINLNVANPSWSYTGPMATARRQHNLTLLPDGKVLATGGSGGGGGGESPGAEAGGAEIPQEDLQINLENQTLTVKGERKFVEDEKEGNFHRIERRYGSFVRSFTLPATIETDPAQANYENGVLSITLQKKEAAKPKQLKIEIGSGSNSKPAPKQMEGSRAA
jgi:hypothetical protein